MQATAQTDQDSVTFEVVSAIARGACVARDQVAMSTRLVEDLDCDSLDVIEMVMDLEDEFGMEITDEEAAGFKTVQQIVDCVRSKVSKNP